MSRRSIVIVGAGHAGVQAAASLREEGSGDAIVLLSGEAELPYQRPPLSKAFLKGAMDLAGLPLRAEQFYRDPRHRSAPRRTGFAHRPALRRRVELSSGGAAPFDHLILATGARPRPLEIPGVDLGGVLGLRSIVDAQAIRERLGPGRRVVVIGAGFIGLEIAATALALGGEVTIVEIADRPLGRAVSPLTSSFFLEAHEAFGAKFRFGVGVAAIKGSAGEAEEVILSNGERLRADVVIVGVGVFAEDRAGARSGPGLRQRRRRRRMARRLPIRPSPQSATARNSRSASLGIPLRLESVQNATDQARCVARRLTGKAEALRGDAVVLERSGRPQAADRRAVARGRPLGSARRSQIARVRGVRLSRGRARGGRDGQPRRASTWRRGGSSAAPCR